MPSSVFSSMVLNHPLDRRLIQLGRFVHDVSRPAVECHQPASLTIEEYVEPPPPYTTIADGDKKPAAAVAAAVAAADKKNMTTDSAVAATTVTTTAAAAVTPLPRSATTTTTSTAQVTQRYEDIHKILTKTRDTRLGAVLASIFLTSTASGSTSRETSTALRADRGTLTELVDPAGYFARACRDEGLRAWMEEQGRRLRPRVYMVCGLKTFTDAKVERRATSGWSVNPSTDMLLPGAPGLGLEQTPLGGMGGAAGLTGTAGAQVRSMTDLQEGYNLLGEKVYSVIFRKVKFGFLSSRDVDKASLDKKETMWRSCFDSRGDGDEDDDVVEVGLEDEVDGEEFEEEYLEYTSRTEKVFVSKEDY